MPNRYSRRRFLQTTAVAGAAGLVAGTAAAADKKPSANDQLHVGVIGVAGQGEYDWSHVAAAGAAIVALCDVDERRTGKARERFIMAVFSILSTPNGRANRSPPSSAQTTTPPANSCPSWGTTRMGTISTLTSPTPWWRRSATPRRVPSRINRP